jgi:hypothetical protein
MLLALLLAAQVADRSAAPPAGTPCLTCAHRTEFPTRSRYRLDPATAEGTIAEDRGLREDGTRCGVIGARQCTRKPRTIFRTPFPD